MSVKGTKVHTVTTQTANAEADRGVSHLDTLWVKGARAHNLKNVEIAIPRDSMVVFTGLSGSGTVSYTHLTLPTNREV